MRRLRMFVYAVVGAAVLASCASSAEPVTQSDGTSSTALTPASLTCITDGKHCSARHTCCSDWCDTSTNTCGTTLISRSWTMPAGQEGYKCTTFQVPSDLYLTAFHNVSPSGTYEMVVAKSSTTQMIGDYDCSAGTNLLDSQGVYASGLGTPDFALPSGVAVHVAAGDYLTLNLHVFNAGTQELSGVSGVLVSTTSSKHVANVAEFAYAGTLSISIPNDGVTHIAQGGCSAPADHQIVALWPHLQSFGTQVALNVTDNGITRTAFSTPYTVSSQPIYGVVPSPQVIRQFDQLQVTCSYVNTSSQTVTFGDSTVDEQCFVGMYRYPPLAGTNMFSCVN